MKPHRIGPLWTRLRVLGRRVGIDREATRPSEAESSADLRSDGGAAEGRHLEELPDGAGCTEIWEHLSDRPERDVVADD